jgi:hypothetical protein
MLAGMAGVIVVDQRRVGGDQHQVIRFRLAGDLGEIVVAEGEVLRECPIGGNILLPILKMHGTLSPIQPRLVVMRGIVNQVLSVRQLHAIRTGEGAKVVVEGMVLFDDDDYVLDGTA